MLKLRPYQESAIQSIFEFFDRHNGNPLVSMNVGTGKSVVIAGLCQKVLEIDKFAKIIVAVSTKELVQQNYNKFVEMAPELDAGLFSAGLNKRQLGRLVTFCGIQSIYNKAEHFGKTDLLIVDEAHQINKSQTGTWHKLINDLTAINPHLRVCGFTGSPWRTVEGDLTEGDGKLFDEIVFETNLIEMIDQGYLCPITNRPTTTRLTTDGVHKRNGDFIESELQKAVDVDELTRSCVREMVECGAERKKWLIFAAGIDHALHIRDAVRACGITCETVSGKTPTAERDEIIRKYKSGEVRCVSQVNVLSTGFDAPDIDLIGFMRPTISPIVWTQALGRGLRISPEKENCLLRDFTNNSNYFPPLDRIRGRDKRTSGQGEAPSKLCPKCFELNPASARVCINCETEFPRDDTPDLNRHASTAALLSNQIAIDKHPVSSVNYFTHKKEGRPDSLRVDYRCGVRVFREWVCLEHDGGARKKAERWWKMRSSGTVPFLVSDALNQSKGLKKPTAIHVRKNGKYDEVIGHDF